MNLPMYNSIKKYSASKPTVFHMPGHKLGKGLPDDFIKNLAVLDITEIPGFDDLHHPEGIVKEAQELAALTFGADETFFLVNGSSGGIHAAIMTVCKPGEKIIVVRDCHKSAINAMILAGAEPVYVSPEFDKTFGITSAVLAKELEAAIVKNPEAVAIFITSPGYYGICSDISEISRLAHLYKKLLIIDEAHGAHLGFNKTLPGNAMQGDADICVQSAHKTLVAFTQGAYLHVKGNRIDREKLRFNLRLLQTSSPSYLIMSSLDVARAVMQHKGNKLLEELLYNIEKFKDEIINLEKLKLLAEEDLEFGRLDRTRIVIKTRGMGISGYDTENILRQEYNIQVEMSDLYNIVCIATIADKKEDFKKLALALTQLSVKFKDRCVLADITNKKFEIPLTGILLKDIRKYDGTKVKLGRALGKVSLDSITPYPPGIPVLCPGEIVNEEIVQYIHTIIASGGRVNGLSGNMEINIVK